MTTQSARSTHQSHITALIGTHLSTGQLALVDNPRDPMRGFFYWGYFYFTYTNTAPFQAEGTVMPG